MLILVDKNIIIQTKFSFSFPFAINLCVDCYFAVSLAVDQNVD